MNFEVQMYINLINFVNKKNFIKEKNKCWFVKPTQFTETTLLGGVWLYWLKLCEEINVE